MTIGMRVVNKYKAERPLVIKKVTTKLCSLSTPELHIHIQLSLLQVPFGFRSCRGIEIDTSNQLSFSCIFDRLCENCSRQSAIRPQFQDMTAGKIRHFIQLQGIFPSQPAGNSNIDENFFLDRTESKEAVILINEPWPGKRPLVWRNVYADLCRIYP